MKLIACSFWSILITLSFTSCSKDLLNLEKEYPGVDRELWEFYEEFELQAAIRGIDINLQNISVSGEISEIIESGVAGVCQYGSAIQNHITIDESYWNRANNLNKEFVVFHELGHCVLLRGHDERQNANGLCLSIMRSGTGNCIDAYSSQNRVAYLDELFEPKE